MAIGTGTALLGSAIIGGLASKSAAKSNSKGIDKGIDATNDLLSPYTQAGADSIGSLQEFINQGQGQNFRDTQAFKDITNSARAHVGIPGLNSGGRQTALLDYYMTNYRPQQLAEQSLLYRGGISAAGGQANQLGSLYGQQGASNAAGTLGMANAANSAINNWAFLDAWKNR